MKRQTQWYKSASPNSRNLGGLMGVFFSLLTLTSFANNGDSVQCSTPEWIERRKNITFSYSLSASDKVSLENQFGDINVSFWNKDEIKVEVTILANATSEERAANFISTVDVQGKKADGTVSIKTTIDREGGNYNNNTWNWKGGSNEKNSLK
ncbi:MAG: hypothetical protein ACOVO2_03060, partial [Emticicia sp.]